jgi:aspartyl-tRNA(Asn)/glutamyl-tRNA(Gln) amidotransferase subunit A
VLTRAMLDGLDNFWRARFWGDIENLSEERRDSILPYIHSWAKGGADVSGVDAVKGFNQTIEMRKTCGALFRRRRCGAVADQPDRLLSGRMGLADQ